MMSADDQLNVTPQPVEAPCMFFKETRHHEMGCVILVGKPSRKAAKACLNTPITADLHRRLKQRIVGSISMGSAVLLEWALDELETRSIAIEARPKA
jgi:hypothetical protein